MEKDTIEGLKSGAFGLSGAAIIVFGGLAGNYFFHKHMPNNSKVQSGYVAPSNLEITCEDLDKNGQRETIMKVDGKQYLLKYDTNHKPVLQEYEVMPAKVVPK